MHAVQAAPTSTILQTIIPPTSLLYDIGSSIRQFLNLFVRNITSTNVTTTNLTTTNSTSTNATSTNVATTNLSATNASSTNATSTNLAVLNTASTTNLTISGLGNTGTQCLQANNQGVISVTGSACGAGGGGGTGASSDFNYIVGNQGTYLAATNTAVGMFASASSTFNQLSVGRSTTTQATSTYANVTSFLNSSGTSTFATGTFSMLNNIIVVDGVKYAQNSTGINNAISAAPVGVCSTIFLPSGTYSITSNINYQQKCLTLEGASASSTILMANGVSGGIFYDFVGGNNNPYGRPYWGLHNVTMDVNYTNTISCIQTGSVLFFDIRNTRCLHLTNLWGVKIGSIGGTLGSETQSDIDGSASTGNFVNNEIATSTFSTLEGNLFVNVRNSYIAENYGHHLTQGPAVWALYGYSKNNVLAYNRAEVAMKVVYLQGSDHNIVSNNTFSYVSGAFPGHHITLINSDHNKIENNQLTGNNDGSSGAGGIAMYDDSGTFDGHASYHPSSDYNDVKNNLIDGAYDGVIFPSQTGAAQSRKQSFNNIEGNSLLNILHSAVYIGHSSTEGMYNNRIVNNVATSTKVFSAGTYSIVGSTTKPELTARVEVSGNTASTSRAGGDSSGVYISGAISCFIHDNNITGTGKGSYSDLQIENSVNCSEQGNGGWSDSGNNVVLTVSTDHVGIGSSSPRNLLTVQGTPANTAPLVQFGDDSTNAANTKLLLENRWTGAGAPTFLVRRNVSTPQFAVDANGNVGVATDTPAQLFSVAGDSYFTGGIGVGRATSTDGNIETTGAVQVGGVLSVTGATSLNTLTTSGRAGIGTTSPDSGMSVNLSTGRAILHVGDDSTNSSITQYFGHFLSERAEQTKPRTG